MTDQHIFQPVSATEPQTICRNLRRGGSTTVQGRTDEPASRPPSSTATCQVRVPLKTSTTGSQSGNPQWCAWLYVHSQQLHNAHAENI